MFVYFSSILLLLLLIYYFYNRKNFSKWKNLNVPGPEPVLFFGNMKKVALMETSFNDVCKEIYQKFSYCKYVGIYIMQCPAILVRDPEIVESVLVKNFTSFHDNAYDTKKEVDPIIHDNPFNSKGEIWKRQRSQHLSSLTPAKVKNMFHDVSECSDRMVNYLNEKIEKSNKTFTIDALELAARYTTDTCTAIGLGINSNSFTEGEAELYETSKTLFDHGVVGGMKLFCVFLFPNLANWIHLSFFPKYVFEKYKNLVTEILKYRNQNNIKKNDFFEHIQEFRGQKMSIYEMTTQLGGLYLDGSLTSSGVMNFLLFLVANHEEVQEKLRNEIKEFLNKNGDVLTCDLLQEMSYLNAVISEVLRLYPPFPNLTKMCTRTCILPKPTPNSSDLTVEAGTTVIIPVNSIHLDEKYYSNPYEFNPERFLNGENDSMTKYTYLPFGDGPRICLGMRFGILQTKLMLLKLVHNFKLILNKDKTILPVKMRPHFLLMPKDCFWITLEKV